MAGSGADRRGIRPRRVDAATRLSLALLARLLEWRDVLAVVRPETMIRWHRAGWRLFLQFKSWPRRPPIPVVLRQLIRRIADENSQWGEKRSANQLLLKPGLRVSPRTVRKYMAKRPPGRPRGDHRWATFLRNHARAIVACDFFVAVTATFRLLYVFVVIHHRSRRLLHFNVTAHPTAAWTPQQLREAIGLEDDYRYLLHDRDSIFAGSLDRSIKNLGLSVLKSPPHSPRANAINMRTGDRNDPSRVPGLVDSVIRAALAIDAERLGEALQRGASAHGVGSGSPRSARRSGIVRQ
jgi:hypothetical protein